MGWPQGIIPAATFLLLIHLAATHGRLLREDDVRSRRSGYDDWTPQNRSRRTCTPVGRQPVTFPDNIAGRCNIDYSIDSGYIGVTDVDYLFYIKFGPKHQVPNPPIVFWTNGGPGCSAMEGAFDELGPLKLVESKSASPLYTGTLSDNPYSWNSYAHLVTVDQPRYVGFSFGSGPRAFTSETAGQDMVKFILKFFDLYPEIPSDSPVIIAGESFSGHYVPGWSKEILDHNQRVEGGDSGNKINLKGLALGNVCVDDNMQIDSPKYLEFLRTSKLLPAEDRTTSVNTANSHVRSHIGYNPNFYDFRIKAVDSCPACYSYDYSQFQNWLISQPVQNALHTCPGSGDDAFTGNSGGCIPYRPFDRGVPNRHFADILARTLNEDIPVSFYFGKTDLACDYVGGTAMAESLNWKGREQFKSATLMDITIAGAVAGQYRQHGKLSWFQVEDAGHMVPNDQPAAAFFAINHLLNRDIPWSPNSSAMVAGDITCAPTELATNVPSMDPTSSAPTPTPSEEDCPVCQTCAPTNPPVSTMPTAGFDLSLCPTPSPTKADKTTSGHVVADLECPLKCIECSKSEPAQVVSGVSDTVVIAGLSSTVAVLFIAFVIALLRNMTSQKYSRIGGGSYENPTFKSTKTKFIVDSDSDDNNY